MKHLIVQVIHYDSTDHGDYEYRVGQPRVHLNARPDVAVVDVHIYHPDFSDLAVGADLVILHMITEPEVLSVIQVRREQGLKTIYEISDALLNPKEEDDFSDPVDRQNLLYYASLCDAVQFSNRELADMLGFLNLDHVVFENQIQTATNEKMPHDGFVLGIRVNESDGDSLGEIAPVLVDFCKRHADISLAFMGPRHHYDTHFSILPRQQRQYHPHGSFEENRSFTKGLDLGIAPYPKRCSSDTHFLEYAAGGVAPMLPASLPYTALPDDVALFFDDCGELLSQLQRCYEDREYLSKRSESAQEYVREHRAICMDERAAFYLEIIGDHAQGMAVSEDHQIVGPQIKPVREAMRLLGDRKSRPALALLNTIIREHGEDFITHLLRACSLKALRRYPRLFNDYYVLCGDQIYGDQFAALMHDLLLDANPDEAFELRSKIEDPVTALLCTPDDEIDEAFMWRQILVHNPFHLEALMALSKLHEQAKYHDEARRLAALAEVLQADTETFLVGAKAWEPEEAIP